MMFTGIKCDSEVLNPPWISILKHMTQMMLLMPHYLNRCHKVRGSGWNGKTLFLKHLPGWKLWTFACFFVMLVCERGPGGLINFGIIYFIARWSRSRYCIWNKRHSVYVSKKAQTIAFVEGNIVSVASRWKASGPNL